MKVLKVIYEKLLNFFGKIHWEFLYKIKFGKHYKLTEEDHRRVKALLNPSYFIILTRRNTHLSTYLTCLGHFIKTGRWGFYSHALMNVDEGNARDDSDFKLLEAVGVGVKYSTFLEVFDCDSVVLLAPKNLDMTDWTKILDMYLKQEGKEYDCFLDLVDDTKVNCVESVRRALQALPDYNEKFERFELMIRTMGNLTPDLFYECPDFELILEIRR